MKMKRIALATAAMFAIAAPAAFAAGTQYHSDTSDSYSSGMTKGADQANRSDSTYNRGMNGSEQTNRSDSSYRNDNQSGKSDWGHGRNMSNDTSTVRKVQRALEDQGYDPKTRAALIQYQQVKNIRDKGQINPQTLAELNISPQMMDSGKDAGSTMRDQDEMKGKNQGS
jgi:hypothetical protein